MKARTTRTGRTKPNDIRRDIGQLLIVGFEEAEPSSAVTSLLQKIQPAGVILFARNIVSPAQTYGLLEECRKQVSEPLFTCVDMEGGRVDRFRKAIASSPSAADVFATHNRLLFRKHGRVIGQLCRAMGFNVDFAPVLDLALEASRSVMSSRAVSADPKQVVRYAREFLLGLRSAGVIGAGKHFPGLGEANLDTHLELPAIAKSLDRLWQEDIYPYRAMRRELPMVLVGHATYSAVTNDGAPASLSKKWISEILRRKIGYRGLIVSDDLEMGGVLAAGPIEQAAVEHIRAGGDLCLICRQQEFIERSYEALIREAEQNSRFALRVVESAGRVRTFKKKSAEIRHKIAIPTPERIQKWSLMVEELSRQVRPTIPQANS